MKKGERIYMVFINESEEGPGYWNLYNDIHEAVGCEGGEAEIWSATPKLEGTFKKESVLKRIKIKGKKKENVISP